MLEERQGCADEEGGRGFGERSSRARYELVRAEVGHFPAKVPPSEVAYFEDTLRLLGEAELNSPTSLVLGNFSPIEISPPAASSLSVP